MTSSKKKQSIIKKIWKSREILQKNKVFVFGITLNAIVLIYLSSTFARSWNLLIGSNGKLTMLIAAPFLLFKILLAIMLILNILFLYSRRIKQETGSSKYGDNLLGINTLIVLMDYLPEEQKRVLSDLRKRWRNCNNCEFIVIIKTVNFWFRHCWNNALYEIGKKVKKTLPNRRI